MSLKDDIENASKILTSMQEKLPCEHCKEDVRWRNHITVCHSMSGNSGLIRPYYSLFCNENCLLLYLQYFSLRK